MAKHPNAYQYNGYELERRYMDWINENNGYNGEGDKTYEVLCLDWMSAHSKGEFDFCMKVNSPRRYVLIDMVGSYEKNGKVCLNTSHKTWQKKTEQIHSPDEGYLCFLYCNEFRYIKITGDLPVGDIVLTRGRLNHMKIAESVFKCDEILPFPDDLPEEDLKAIEQCKNDDDVMIILYIDDAGKNRADIVKMTPLFSHDEEKKTTQ